jgi:hypothetical protein
LHLQVLSALIRVIRSADETIAVQTGISQILGGCQSTVLFADDVIDFASEMGIIFVNKTVFTKPTGPRHDEASQIRANVGATHP